ncbi:hypothetical protein T11_17164 [Trichinella zimbabwensis]|uniref:Uncharacterized protein n=1 Tax=Trichinella zimbabwensis TaxID=268475 RepID=A0A0V1HUX6_9BILA|nr:hypothetical protein T11_17164 [Trichinella zimbabwensis]
MVCVLEMKLEASKDCVINRTYRLGSMNICLRGYVKRYGFAAKAHHKPQLLSSGTYKWEAL